MKEKVLAILKPLLAAKGFKKEELEGLADIAVKNLTAESTDEDIKSACDNLVPYAELMQKVGNRYATAEAKKYEGWVKPTPNDPTPPTPPTPPAPAPVSVTKEEMQAAIAEALAPYKAKEEKERLRSILDSHDKVKAIPAAFRSHYSLAKEEDLDTVAAQIEQDYASMKAELLKSGEFVAPPQAGGGIGDNDDLIAQLQAMNKPSANN